MAPMDSTAGFGEASPPVAAAPEVLDRLMAYFDGLTDTAKLAEIAIANGAQAPDDRPGWTIFAAYPDGHDSPTLYWSHPDDDLQIDLPARLHATLAQATEAVEVKIDDRDFVAGAEWLTPQGYRRRWAARLPPAAGPAPNTGGMWKTIARKLAGKKRRITAETEKLNEARVRESIARLESGSTPGRP